MSVVQNEGRAEQSRGAVTAPQWVPVVVLPEAPPGVFDRRRMRRMGCQSDTANSLVKDVLATTDVYMFVAARRTDTGCGS